MRGERKCESHYIREEVLNSLVLENLRTVISYARDYEDEFIRQVTDNALTEQIKQQATVKRQFEQQTRRMGEIDTIIQRLYEDNVTGKLPDERFSKMYDTYEKEQKQLQISTTELQASIRRCRELGRTNLHRDSRQEDRFGR